MYLPTKALFVITRCIVNDLKLVSHDGCYYLLNQCLRDRQRRVQLFELTDDYIVRFELLKGCLSETAAEQNTNTNYCLHSLPQRSTLTRAKAKRRLRLDGPTPTLINTARTLQDEAIQ